MTAQYQLYSTALYLYCNATVHCTLSVPLENQSLQKLYGTKVNANTFKALVTAQYAGVPVELAPFEMGVTNKTPAFLKLNPIGKVLTVPFYTVPYCLRYILSPVYPCHPWCGIPLVYPLRWGSPTSPRIPQAQSYWEGTVSVTPPPPLPRPPLGFEISGLGRRV